MFGKKEPKENKVEKPKDWTPAQKASQQKLQDRLKLNRYENGDGTLR